MVVEQLDSMDRKIMSELDRTARLSYSEIGKRLGIAKETVKYRINQLEERGVIEGYYTLIDLTKIGYVLFRVYLRLANASPDVEEEMKRYLVRSENVSVFYRINGPFHMALGTWAPSIWEYEKFWLDFTQRFGTYIATSQLSIMTEYREYTREFGTGKDKDVFITISESKKQELDGIDKQILSYLSSNAKASLVEIAGKTGISIPTIRGRMKSLSEHKVLVGFRPIINLAKLGKEYYKVDLMLAKYDRAAEIRQTIVSHPSVAYSESTIGGSDIEFDLEIRGFDEFNKIMEEFRKKFAEDIRDYSYYSRVENYKTSYMPGMKTRS